MIPFHSRKACFRCHRNKHLDEFYRHPMMSDGHLGKCKSCTKKDARSNYRRHIEYYRRYDKARQGSKKRRGLKITYMNKWRERHPGSHIAHRRVSEAIRAGTLKKLPCVICGSNKSEAHHPDYRMPLNVVWLCLKHHRLVEGRLVVQCR